MMDDPEDKKPENWVEEKRMVDANVTCHGWKSHWAMLWAGSQFMGHPGLIQWGLINQRGMVLGNRHRHGSAPT